MTRTDVFIVGGGPAGLAAAIAARRRGFNVIVADGAVPPIDKPCGEGLMPDGVEALRKLEISIPPEHSHRFRGIRFLSSGLAVDARFPRGVGIGVRRLTLHRLLIAAAERFGITLLWQTPVTGLDREGVHLRNEVVRCRWVVGADGGQSLTRQWAGLDKYLCDRTRFAFRRHYHLVPWSDCMEIHWGPGCQIYVTPIAADEICVALVSRNPRLRLDEALMAFPDLQKRLHSAPRTSAERGAMSVTRKLRGVFRERVVLIGDASGAVDSITGEGLCLSFRQAEVLADCLVTGSLDRYQRIHRRLARRAVIMARLMLTLDWKPAFRQRVMRALNSDPGLFRRFLTTHVGESSLMDLAGASLTLGARVFHA